MAFSFVNPFLPLFIQELGDFNNKQAAFWAGIALGGGGLAMFLSSPVCAIIADRWGRKPMVLRAMFGASAILALMGIVSNRNPPFQPTTRRFSSVIALGYDAPVPHAVSPSPL